ncbi:hypothetical protein AURANDRAFT_66159 [Aureococcus anophagefferens]|uniref:Uncharacterized protein n=1 Tax=Aureococcus anophagefferens TaxID=44056 RepID=F0YGK4_AURAN|nr:hypothetical protein AURANDRAFT_66159 [Aureococcus anophagefferens]EGB05686.1 hypothetical protein AURANDRAFT_66159 [Aureococcus anophagefferens]|eukprot:XP_009039527.1 hypothetical protein AURANDRAFT_66159 [Aureococcus anophagefferens]
MKLIRALCVLAAAEAFVAPTPRRNPYATLAATSQQADAGKDEKAAKLPTIVDGGHPMFGKKLRVRGAKMSRSGADRFSNLRCFAEPGDPYASPLNYLLAHGDEVTCLDFKDFAGQTWVMHERSRQRRGLIPGHEADLGAVTEDHDRVRVERVSGLALDGIHAVRVVAEVAVDRAVSAAALPLVAVVLVLAREPVRLREVDLDVSSSGCESTVKSTTIGDAFSSSSECVRSIIAGA